MTYDKRIVDYCNTHNVDLGIQNVYTPIVEIEQATGYSFINEVSKDAKEICILFNVEFFEYFIKQDYIKNNGIKLTFCYDCEFDKAVVLDYKYSNMELIDLTTFSQTKDIEEIKTAMGNRKFDVVFSNPPYETIDLNILNSIFNIAKKIVFIHPTTFLLDNKFKKKLYNNIRNTNYLENVVMFWGNKMFDIGLFCPLAITIWNMNKTNNMCKVIDNAITHTEYECKINDISIHGTNNYKDLWNTINMYMKNHNGNIQEHITNENMLNDYSIRFSLIQGTSHVVDYYSDDFFNLTGKNVDKNYCDHTFRFADHVNRKLHWSFNNDIERDNFIQYCKTKVVRFLLSIVKSGSHIDNGELEIIPWLDFTRSWNDKELCKEFNISKELWKYIDKFIPDYYDDYKSGFEQPVTLTEREKFVLTFWDQLNTNFIFEDFRKVIENPLQKKYPKNKHSYEACLFLIQRLRDCGYVEFVKKGVYKKLK